MYSKKWLLLLVVSFASLLPLSDCAGGITAGSAPSSLATSTAPASVASTPDADAVLAQTVSAISNIKAYNLNINLQEDYDVYPGPNGTESSNTTTIWNISKLVYVAGKNLQTSVDIEGPFSPAFKWESRLIDGWEYSKNISPPVFQNGAPMTSWRKTQMTDQVLDRLWTDENQLSQLQTLIKSATQAGLEGNDNINGADCYLLKVIPSGEAATNWVLSQQQSGGPSFYWWKTGLQQSQEIYNQAYQSSSIKLWVAKDKIQVLKASVDALFDVESVNVNRGELGLPVSSGQENSHDVGFDKIVTDFQDELQFSVYNQALSIVPPPDDEIQ